MVYRENGRRYIPIKFSVRGRDLAGTIQEVQTRLDRSVRLPGGYHYEWAGEYDSLRKEQQRLAIIIPITLAMILGLLYVSFNSIRDALAVLSVLPFGIAGGCIGASRLGHTFQHFRSRGICLRYRRRHSWGPRFCRRYSASGGA
jgi:heavy metal efflux system protein